MNLPIPCRITTAGIYEWTEPIIHDTLDIAIDIQCDDVTIIFTDLILEFPTNYNSDAEMNKQYGINVNKRSDIKIIGTRIILTHVHILENLEINAVYARYCKNMKINVKQTVGFEDTIITNCDNVLISNCHWNNAKIENTKNIVINNSHINGTYYEKILGGYNISKIVLTVGVIAIMVFLGYKCRR
jgi:hypothetical protein